MKYGVPGSADILGVWLREAHRPINRGMRLGGLETVAYGQAIAIETKRGKGGVQSKQQERWQRAFEQVGGVYILARDIGDVAAVIGPPP